MTYFDPTLTQTEKETLAPAIEATLTGWQFRREGKHITAWKECWGHVQVGGKGVRPLKERTAQALAERIMMYEMGRLLIRGKSDEQ